MKRRIRNKLRKKRMEALVCEGSGLLNIGRPSNSMEAKVLSNYVRNKYPSLVGTPDIIEMPSFGGMAKSLNKPIPIKPITLVEK